MTTVAQVADRLEVLARAAEYAASSLRSDLTDYPSLAWANPALNAVKDELVNTEGLLVEFHTQVSFARAEAEADAASRAETDAASP